jgi:hypothetical protein
MTMRSQSGVQARTVDPSEEQEHARRPARGHAPETRRVRVTVAVDVAGRTDAQAHELSRIPA